MLIVRHIKIKLFLIMTFLLLLNVRGISQVPNYLANNPEWRVHHQLDSNYPCVEYSDYVIYLSGDSLISSYAYKKVFKRGITNYQWYGSNQTGNPNFTCYGVDTFNLFVGLIRQDSMRFYIRDGSTDLLLIDFNLEVGDTINNWALNNSNGWHVSSIDSVLINAEYRRISYLNNGGLDSTLLIEGIGSGAGLIERLPTFFEDDFYLTCYAQNQNVLWTNPFVQGACNFDVGLDASSISEIVVYPNPSNEFFHVSNSIGTSMKYTIYNLDGKMVSSGFIENESEGIGANLISGTYFLHLKTISGQAIRKIIKI